MADISIIHEGNTDYYVKDAAGRLALAEVENKGAKNRFLYGDLIGITDNFSNKPLSLPAGEYKIMFVSTASSGTFAIRLKDSEDNSIFYIMANNAATTRIYDVTIATDAAKITVYSSVSNNFTNFMICSKAEWDISQSYVPYAKTNRDLTVLTDEDRDALVEIVDGGAKNRWEITIPSTLPTGFTATIDTDGGLVLNGTTGATALTFATSIQFHAGETVVLSGCPSGGNDDSYRLDILRGVNTNYCYGNPVIATDFTETTYPVRIRIAANYTCNNLKFFPMVCSLASWKISQTYQPYRPSYQELSDAVDSLENGSFVGIELQSGDDLNNFSRGRYYCRSATISAQILNNPNTGSGFVLDHMYNVGNVVQMLYPSSSSNIVIYKRSYASSSWRPWCKFEGTEVT